MAILFILKKNPFINTTNLFIYCSLVWSFQLIWEHSVVTFSLYTLSVSCVCFGCVVKVPLTGILQMFGFAVWKIMNPVSPFNEPLFLKEHFKEQAIIFWSLSSRCEDKQHISSSCFLSSLSNLCVYVWSLTRSFSLIDGWLEQAGFWGSRVAWVDFGGALVTL